ncbi:MAG: carbohydrate ABC transporter permease, partial [Eubacteriales bacterium]|nr:carbohydrate ABC transporter permease [Eubacteriales bacterium]
MRGVKRAIRHSAGDRLFLCMDYVLLTAFLLTLAYPLLFVVSAAFSGGSATMNLNLWPASPTLAGFRAVFGYRAIWTGYLNSLLYMTLGTAVSLAVTVLCAYPLSRGNFRFGGVMMG